MSDLAVKLRLALADDGVAQKIARVAASVLGLRREIDQLGDAGKKSTRSLREGIDSISTQLARLQAGAIALTGVFKGVGFFGDIARTAADFESLEVSLKAVFGSAQAARNEMAAMRSASDALGIPIRDLAEQYVGFAAAAKGSALEGQQAREIFLAVAEAGTALGLRSDQIARSLLALQQMMSKTRVSAEEMQQQLGENLYGALSIAARSIGYTTDKFVDMMQSGLLPAEKLLPAFAAQLRKEIGGGAEDASNTARAAFARLDNAFTDLKLQFAQSGFMDALVTSARDLTGALKDPQFRQSVRELGALIGKLIKLIVEHGKDLATIAGIITGARLGYTLGPWGALGGAAIGGIGVNKVFPNDPVKEVQDEIKSLQEDVDRTRKILQTSKVGRDRNPFLLFDLKLDKKSLESAKRVLKEREQMLADAQRRLRELTGQAQATTADAAENSNEDALSIARTSFNAFVANFRDNAQKLEDALSELKERAKKANISPDSPEYKSAEAAIRKKFAGESSRSDVRDRLQVASAALDAELTVLKDGLQRQKTALEAALEDRLLSIRDYYAQKTRIEQAEVDADIRRVQAQIAQQQQLSARASGGEQLRARAEIAKLEADLIVLNSKRSDIEQANARAAARAERELADALAAAREELAQLTGTDTAEQRRAAIERGLRDLRARLAAEPGAEGVSLIDRLIDVKAAQANLAALETAWRQVTERLRNDQEAIGIQQQAGLLTEAQARERIVSLQRESAAEMQRLLPAMQQAAQAIGPEAVIRVQAWRNELERTRLTVDELAPLWNRIGESFGTALQAMITGAQSWREALSNLFRQVADAFLQQIVIQPFQRWVAMQARMLAMKLGFVQQEQAIEQAAAAKSVAQKSAETTAKVAMDAAQAGAGAAASQAAIPVVGPGLAIAAMVTIFAAVMALLGKVKKFAAGGLVTGPGTSTSDSIPARLSAGEYVVRAAAVQRVGVAFLDALNGLRTPPAWDGQRLAFAAGGLVPAVQVQAAAPQVNQAVRIVNAIDPGVTHDHLQTPAGERVILNIIGRNARAIRAALQG